jgi:hypothetical protein
MLRHDTDVRKDNGCIRRDVKKGKIKLFGHCEGWVGKYIYMEQ